MNVTLKTDLPHRFGKTVKTSVCDLTYDSKGEVSVSLVQAAKILQLGLGLVAVDPKDYEQKVREFEKTAGRPIEKVLDQIEETRSSISLDALQELLIKEREDKVSLLSRIQDLEAQIAESGDGASDVAIKGLKKQVSELQEENKALVKANKLLTEENVVLNQKAPATDEKEEANENKEEDETKKAEERAELVTKLTSYNMAALQKLATESQLPKEQWENLKKKKDLVEYLADNIE